MRVEVAVVITTGLKREEGGPRADIVVLYLCRYGRSRDRRVELRLVFGGGASYRPKMLDASRDAAQEQGRKAEGAVQGRRLVILDVPSVP